MKRKQGISLIVLVITIIVMVIIAATVVISISNTGIINKANQAVNSTNQKEVEQLAALAWAEEFMDGKRGETLKTAVLEKLSEYTSSYDIEVTDSGVTVKGDGTTNNAGTNTGNNAGDVLAGAGIYKTGTNELVYSMEELIDNGMITIEFNYYEDAADIPAANSAGDLVLPSNAGISTIGSINDEEITGITIPASVKYISDNAFSGCTNLKTLTFEEGSKLKLIGYDAFGRNEDLDITINYPGTIEEWESIESYSTWTVANEASSMGKVICSDGTIYIAIPLGE